MKLASDLIGLTHQWKRRRKKIKSISRKIVENAKEVDPVVFDAKPRAAEHRRLLFFQEETP